VTDDAAAILHFALEGFDRLAASALVTLVGVKGGAARAIGAQMAVHGDGAFCGFVSGGCTEAAVAAEALAAIEAGGDRFLHLGEGSKFFDIVLPCGGAITLYIHIVRDRDPIEEAMKSLANRRSVSLAIDTGRQTTVLRQDCAETGWSEVVFVRSYCPKTRLIVCGRGIEGEVTAGLGEAAGFDVVAADTPAALDRTQIDPYTAVVLLYHDLNVELPILQAALDGKPYYIGALGSSKTHAKRLEALQRIGYGDGVADRIHAPIGLVKAKDAQTLGLSILAEVAAARTCR
jgi:xanthine dehydrogenase accessory factor